MKLGAALILLVSVTVAGAPAVFALWEDSITVAATVSVADLSPVKADVKITPQNLNAGSSGDPLEAQISFSRGRCSHRDVDLNSITLRVFGDNDAVWVIGEITRNKNKLAVRFDRQEVLDLIGGFTGNKVTLEVRGEGPYACKFTGEDTIGYKPVVVESESISAPGGGAEQPAEDADEPDMTEGNETTDPGQPTTDEGSDTEQSGGDESGSESSSDGDGGGGSDSGSGGAGDSGSGGADSP
jgi:uncharacterized membrane protein YgcG